MGLGRCGAWTEMGFGALAGDPPPSSNLAAPELHSSLALGREVQAAAHEAFDAHRAAQDLLATSFVVRCNVEEKAATAMNIPREQQLYQGLVSLQVPAEEVLSCAIQEKLSLVQTQPEPRKEPDLEGPDLLMFYEPLELFAETPYLSVEGLPPLRLQPPPHPPPRLHLPDVPPAAAVGCLRMPAGIVVEARQRAGGGGRADGAAGTEFERVGPASGAAGDGGPGMAALPGPARRHVYCAQRPHGSSRAVNATVLHGAGSCRRLDSLLPLPTPRAQSSLVLP
uniref:Protein phosphatase 1 regulatory subunit 35 n=1 Tax=Pelodiscus sinensis TaxID=13735 RepID=K7FIG8_PELSI